MTDLTNRRQFLVNTSKATLATGIGLSAFSAFLESCSSARKASQNSSLFSTGYTQKPLPYGYNALEPVIDAQTMEIHYSRHAAAYAKALNEEVLVAKVDTSKPLENILADISKYSTKMRNNAGGHYNHELFWQCMTTKGSEKPSGKLLTAIEAGYGSFAEFKNKFSAAAKTRFGSGWAWLVVDNNKKLKIGSTPNQDNPLMDISEIRGIPVLGLDVWEHAYYLKYQNKRPDYVDNWWKLVDWTFVEKRFEALV